MSESEISEDIEHAHERGEKGIGLTMALWAVFLAIATLASHRAHTEEVKLQTQVNDQWGFYQAKHGRAHQYGMEAEIMALQPGQHDLALKYLKTSTDEECGLPVEPKDCASPLLKGSPVLKQLLAEAKAGKAEKNSSESKPEPEGDKQAAKSGEKPEKPGKEGGSGVKEGATRIQERAKEMEAETQLIERRANCYDAAELFLEVSIVLCSIALLSEAKLYWKLSFVSTTVGVVAVIWGILLR